MRAAVIRRFGSPDVITLLDVPRPVPKPGEVLVRVRAAGVGKWDALIREQKSVVSQGLPLTLGSDIAGVVRTGDQTLGFQPGDEVYGATNPDFIGGYAEYAAVRAEMIAPKPKSLSFVEAASAPVVAVTAWQMLFEYAQVRSGQTILVHGGAGNVGAYAVQLARHAGVRVLATASASDLAYVAGLGADTVIDRQESFEDIVHDVDAVIDTVGGDVRRRSYAALRSGGILVSAVSPIATGEQDRQDVRSVFFIVQVTRARLEPLTKLFEADELKTRVGPVLPLEDAGAAHYLLDGGSPQKGRIVLDIAAES